MGASKFGRGWWVAVPVIALFVLGIFWIFWPFVDNGDPPPDEGASAVKIVSWNWKKDRTGTIFAVYGSVRNLGDSDIRQVVLELRTIDEEDQIIARHPITVADLPAGGEKPFRKDVPRTGNEARGFLEVLDINP